MISKYIYISIFLVLLCNVLRSQELNLDKAVAQSYPNAHNLAYEGDHSAARLILEKIGNGVKKNSQTSSLLARIDSWDGNYKEARKKFNKITSVERENEGVWISAIKNELYAKNDATALGLANKALIYLKNNTEVERLKELALSNIENKKYPELIEDVNFFRSLKSKKGAKAKNNSKKTKANTEEEPKTEKKVENKPLNRINVRSSVTVFDEIYGAALSSSISFRRKTLAGSLIPRINYSNRNDQTGVQYDLDFYPKFSKRLYAYLNYGYSDSSIYPTHKGGGDLYASIPGALELSFGFRHFSTADRQLTSITNSLGHYRGNYYFSLRSNIAPKSDNLVRFSSNLLVRKYFRDGENYLGGTIGFGYNPELKELRDGDELLAQTILYRESQRMSIHYQFTPKKSPNVYRANLGVSRRELASAKGNFFWSFTAGLTYGVKF